jgi:hypothetical protein
MKPVVIFVILCFPFLGFLKKPSAPLLKLSEYGFFKGEMKKPGSG